MFAKQAAGERVSRRERRASKREPSRSQVDALLDRPRVVVVTRASSYAQLLAKHGTREQARFFLATRGQSLDDLHEDHRRFEAARQAVFAAIPSSWRQAAVTRDDLHRFVFEPGDVVVAIGQDGLVANAAKYLDGQPVIGIDPAPGRNAGVLVPHQPAAAGALLQATVRGRARIEARAMVEAELDDGQRLLALNELFVGHPRHQSARYRLSLGARSERHSSSGVVVTTGTGASGWARSIARERGPECPVLPAPADPRLAFFVREAWPSPITQTELTAGLIEAGESLEIVSELDEGVIFGDGIEDDRLEFRWGSRARIRVASRQLALIV
ncbi:MAG: NAD+ kinase [Enhygromyxa sp.]